MMNKQMVVVLGVCLVLSIIGGFEFYFSSQRQVLECQITVNELEDKLDLFVLEKEIELIRIEERIKQLQPRLDPWTVNRIATAVVRESGVQELSSSLVLHLISVETVPKFNPLSRSKKGAIGLMQIMYKVHSKEDEELAKLKPEDLYHIDKNVHFGCKILRKYMDASDSLTKALERYVGGKNDGYVNAIFRGMAEFEVGGSSNGK